MEFNHNKPLKIGILVSNLGTPDAPTSSALRRYLREFLWDQRIVNMARLPWWFILQVILLLRPRHAAKAYKKVWSDEGSPLLAISKRQHSALQKQLQADIEEPVHIVLGMRYGSPSIADAMEELRAANVDRVLFLPLYPQYSSSTTASTFDAVAQAVKKWWWVPEFRFINNYHDDSGYIKSLVASIHETWEKNGQSEILIFSFHGTPTRFLNEGDPYHCMCQKTARLVAESLGIVESRWQVTFQSIFGREEWLQPYTIKTLQTLGQSGIKSVDVICPGFSADCLETLEEIEEQNKQAFIQAGGEAFHYIPALNDRSDHIQALSQIIRRNLQGWVSLDGKWNQEYNQQENSARAQRAESLGAAKQ